MHCLRRATQHVPLRPLARAIMVDSQDQRLQAEKSAMLAKLFFEGVVTSDNKNVIATATVGVVPVPGRRPLEEEDAENVADILSTEITKLVELVHSEELPILPDVEEEIANLAQYDFLDLGLEANIDEIRFFKEV